MTNIIFKEGIVMKTFISYIMIEAIFWFLVIFALLSYML